MNAMTQPRPSTPPPKYNEPFQELMAPCTNGTWYLIKTYGSAAIARQAKHRASTRFKKPPGTWEFRHGPVGDGTFGIWARNLDGPLVGQDDRET